MTRPQCPSCGSTASLFIDADPPCGGWFCTSSFSICDESLIRQALEEELAAFRLGGYDDGQFDYVSVGKNREVYTSVRKPALSSIMKVPNGT